MKKEIFVLAGVMMLAVAEGACAEEVMGKITELEPIIVTASRAERNSAEVPSSVSVISEEDIRGSNAKSIPDLLKDAQGLYFYDASGVGTAGRINMRGFWGGMSTHQLLLIDGIPQNKGKDKLVDWDLIPLDNIERVEILRGPASALYGDNAMSGVINIITKKPSQTPETKISASHGSFNTQDYGVSTSGFLKKLGYSFGAGRKSTDGFRRNCDYENLHMNGKLDFSIGETNALKLSLDYQEKERGAYPWALSEAQIERDRRQARPGSESDKSDNEKLNLGITDRWDITDILGAEGTFYYRYEDGESFYTSGSSERTTKEQLEDEHTYGLLLRLDANPRLLGMEHLLTAGVDLERDDFDYEDYAAPYQVRGKVDSEYGVKRDKFGPYIQDEIKILEPLKITLGLRYDEVEFDFSDRKNETNSEKKQMSKTTPSCGIVYTYQKDSNLYAAYARAFRTPTIGQMFTYGSSSNCKLNPEEAQNYEVGLRHRFNNRLKAKASLYRMELDNEIWYDYTSRKYQNYGKTSHKGAEGELDLGIIGGLSGFVNYAYARAKNESGDYEGKYLTSIPLHKGSAGLKFESDFGLRANLALTKTGSSYIDSANNDELCGYSTADVKVQYSYKWLCAFLAVDNLLDEVYNSYGYKSGSTKYFNPSPGRTFRYGAEVKF